MYLFYLGIYLTEFLSFNKIRALTQDVNDLAKALRKSEILSVTEDMKVNLTQPIKYKENEDDYVIYIVSIIINIILMDTIFFTILIDSLLYLTKITYFGLEIMNNN